MDVIVRAERNRGRLPLGTFARQVVGSAALLGSVGAIAVGISGVLAAIFRAIGGARFVVGDPSSGALTGAACARWLHAEPNAASCAAALYGVRLARTLRRPAAVRTA